MKKPPEPGDEIDPEEFQKMKGNLQELLGNFANLAGDVLNFREPSETAAKAPPNVQLLGIEFHWEGCEDNEASVPVRNGTREWVPNPRSLIAYAIKPAEEILKTKSLHIKAHFFSDAGKSKIQVRALHKVTSMADLLSPETEIRFGGPDALAMWPPPRSSSVKTSTLFIGANLLLFP